MQENEEISDWLRNERMVSCTSSGKSGKGIETVSFWGGGVVMVGFEIQQVFDAFVKCEM